jgi:hypothetical protein
VRSDFVPPTGSAEEPDVKGFGGGGGHSRRRFVGMPRGIHQPQPEVEDRLVPQQPGSQEEVTPYTTTDVTSALGIMASHMEVRPKGRTSSPKEEKREKENGDGRTHEAREMGIREPVPTFVPALAPHGGPEVIPHERFLEEVLYRALHRQGPAFVSRRRVRVRGCRGFRGCRVGRGINHWPTGFRTLSRVRISKGVSFPLT